MESQGDPFSKISLLGWYAGNSDSVELFMDAFKGKWTLKQRVGGLTVAKKGLHQTILPNTFYRIQLLYDSNSAAFQVFVDGVLTLSLPAAAPAPGTVGFRVKATTGTFQEILIY